MYKKRKRHENRRVGEEFAEGRQSPSRRPRRAALSSPAASERSAPAERRLFRVDLESIKIQRSDRIHLSRCSNSEKNSRENENFMQRFFFRSINDSLEKEIEFNFVFLFRTLKIFLFGGGYSNHAIA